MNLSFRSLKFALLPALFLMRTASAELPLNVQRDWAHLRGDIATILGPGLERSRRDPDGAELRLTQILLKLVRINSYLRNLDSRPGSEILDFIVIGGFSDAINKIGLVTEPEHQNMLRYVRELSRQAAYHSMYEVEDDATVRKAADEQVLRRWLYSAGLGLSTWVYLPLMNKLDWPTGSLMGFFAIVAATGITPFVGRAVPVGETFPTNWLGGHFHRCEATLVNAHLNVKDVTPASPEESRWPSVSAQIDFRKMPR